MWKVSVCDIESLCDRHGGEGVLTPCDKAYINTFTSTKRQREITAWRTLLRQTLREAGETEAARSTIRYSAIGAPYIVDSDIHISVSHSHLKVAIIVSDTPCAIDIESRSRDFERVVERFATPHERTLAELPVLWAAKEALYKISGQEGLDLISDIEIISHATPNTLLGRVADKEFTLQVDTTPHNKEVVVFIR